MTGRLLIRKGVISAIPLLGMLIGILIFHNSRCSAPNENDPHVIELKKLASEMRVYEGCQKTREKVVMKTTLIYYSVYYLCSAKLRLSLLKRTSRRHGAARTCRIALPQKSEIIVGSGQYRER